MHSQQHSSDLFSITGNTATTTIGSAWLGLSDKANEATYAWNDGSEVTYTSWAAGQPQNNGSDEDCVTHNINVRSKPFMASSQCHTIVFSKIYIYQSPKIYFLKVLRDRAMFSDRIQF